MSFSTVAGNSTVAQPVESQTGETATFLARHNRVEELLGNIQDAKDKAIFALLGPVVFSGISIVLGKVSNALLPYSSYAEAPPLSSDRLVIVGANLLGPLAVLAGIAALSAAGFCLVRSPFLVDKHINEQQKLRDMNLQPGEVSKMSGNIPGSMEARIHRAHNQLSPFRP